MKKSHLYSPLGDYAERVKSTPTWVLALQQVSIYTLLCVAGVALCNLLVAFLETSIL